MQGQQQQMISGFHDHLQDVWSRLARSIPGGWVRDAAGLRCIATGSESPSFNLALSGEADTDPQAALDGAQQRFEQAGLSWLLKLHPDRDHELVEHARARGLQLDEEPVNTLDLQEWSTTDSSPLNIRRAEDRIGDAVVCLAEAFEAEPESIARELGANLLTVPTFTVFVGYLDGEPVSTSMLATTAEVGLAGVYSVATRPAHRGQGFGTTLTAAALDEAVRQGYSTAVLEPSPSGARLYRRMGFVPLTTYLEVVVPASRRS